MKIGKEVKDKRTLYDKLDLYTFYADEETNMPRIKTGDRIPVNTIRRFIAHPSLKIYRVNKRNTYIVRRIEDPQIKMKMDAMWKEKDKVMEIFPEISKDIEAAAAKMMKSNCTSCGKNSAKRALVVKMSQEYNKKERDIEPLKNIFTEVEMATIQGLKMATIGSVYKNIKGPRPSCTDCTRKHLAQAIVLISESHLGYPDHRWLAIGHLAEASDEMIADYQIIAEDIRTERLRLMADSTYKPTLMDIIHRITELEETAEKTKGATDDKKDLKEKTSRKKR